ncbi:hypothetical protein NPIL_335621 [Nephila pilipes]|uniref:Uncharacterized protein n=1 Tax=Nephila pilipes TaxID=299642 RepID=A0A8X6P483_NEPPI|nr:hypothetical protein NPIL_335621 [Nephila pilipes]
MCYLSSTSIFDIEVYEATGTFCADTEASQIPFAKDIPLPINDSPVELNNSSCPLSSISIDVPVQSNLQMKLKPVIFICVKKKDRTLMQKKEKT